MREQLLEGSDAMEIFNNKDGLFDSERRCAARVPSTLRDAENSKSGRLIQLRKTMLARWDRNRRTSSQRVADQLFDPPSIKGHGYAKH
jgi:hypothetical protein